MLLKKENRLMQELPLDVIYAIHIPTLLELFHSIILFYSHHNSKGHVTFLIRFFVLQAYMILIFHLEKGHWMTETGQ